MDPGENCERRISVIGYPTSVLQLCPFSSSYFLLSFALDREPRRVEVRERFSQLFQLRRWAMDFYSGEIGHGEHFREQRANVVEMREDTFGSFVRFAAENFVAVDVKPVEKIIFFGRSFLDETREPGFDRLQFSRVHFKIGMKADEV